MACLTFILPEQMQSGDCHYSRGNYLARRRIAVMKKLLEYIGIEPERVRMTWVSAAEGRKFAEVVEEVTEDIKKIGPMIFGSNSFIFFSFILVCILSLFETQ